MSCYTTARAEEETPMCQRSHWTSQWRGQRKEPRWSRSERAGWLQWGGGSLPPSHACVLLGHGQGYSCQPGCADSRAGWDEQKAKDSGAGSGLSSKELSHHGPPNLPPSVGEQGCSPSTLETVGGRASTFAPLIFLSPEERAPH